MDGSTESSLWLDFASLELSDSKGDSIYVAGGRVYFEADVFGDGYSSFTMKGFFDKQGYVEPPYVDNSQLKLILWITIPIGLVLIIGGGVGYFYWRKKDKKTHLD